MKKKSRTPDMYKAGDTRLPEPPKPSPSNPVVVKFNRAGGRYQKGDFATFITETSQLKAWLTDGICVMSSKEEAIAAADAQRKEREERIAKEADKYLVVFFQNHRKWHRGEIAAFSLEEVKELCSKPKRGMMIKWSSGDETWYPATPIARPVREEDLTKTRKELLRDLEEEIAAKYGTSRRKK